MEQRRKMLSAKEVSELLDISNSYAYKVINQLNKELEKAGYLTIHQFVFPERGKNRKMKIGRLFMIHFMNGKRI